MSVGDLRLSGAREHWRERVSMVDMRLMPQLLDEVAVIEGREFEFPWSWEDFKRTLADPTVKADVLMLQTTGEVIGYVVWDEVQIEGIGSARILNLAIKTGFQHQELALWTIDNLLRRLREGGVESVLMRIRTGNMRGLDMFGKAGFEPVAMQFDRLPELAESGEQEVWVGRRV